MTDVSVENETGSASMRANGAVLGRRSLIGAGPALLTATAGTGIQTSDVDCAIILACAEFEALERRFGATPFDLQPGTAAERAASAERDCLVEAQRACLDRICSMEPTTIEGLRAIARSAIVFEPELAGADQVDGFTADRLISAILRGLTLRVET